MSLVYTGDDGLFTHLGKLIKHYNQFKVDAMDATDGLDADRDEILDAFQISDLDVVVNGLTSACERWKDEYVGRRSELVEYVISRLQDNDTVLKQLGVSSADVNEILSVLVARMQDDGQSVVQSDVDVGTPTASGSNIGGGVIVATDILDGATSPGTVNGTLIPANSIYKGKTTEIFADQEFRFRVVADAFQDGLPEGDADISWHGGPAEEPNGLGDGGSGFVGTLKPIHASTNLYVSNADFENFTGDTPDDWTIDTGTPGTNVSSTTNASHGDSALLLSGGGGATSIELSQSINKDTVVANKMYGLTVKLHRDIGGSGGNLTVQFAGTGYTPGSTEKIVKIVSTLPATYSLYHCFVTMPSIIPDDFRIVVLWNGGTPAGNIFVDDIGLGPVNYGGGIGVIAVRDDGPFVRGDQFNLSVAVGTGGLGVFQEFFTKVLGVQLPSDDTSPTIGDDLTQ